MLKSLFATPNNDVADSLDLFAKQFSESNQKLRKRAKAITNDVDICIHTLRTLAKSKITGEHLNGSTTTKPNIQ